ncbi:LuxR C-terminal-related transcriptional regulator [Acrocarpospora macrocephala]|nr:LuxR C-terminal-related transcriptional regulator [Acrocarpospora macrocephala]
MAARSVLSGVLPVETTSFVGRRHEEKLLRDLLDTTRLVTLTGVGGVGKTRLALQTARSMESHLADGVRLADLSAVTDPRLVPQTVAVALGISEESATGAQPTVLARPLLLVMDNCEHLLDACAELAATLLAASANLRILATSRQPLGLAGEYTFVLSPLEAPAITATSPQECAKFDAVALFVDRASAAVTDFRLTEWNAAQIARLCAELDGLPLAIELAAVRLRALSIDQILDRLDERYRLLTGGSRVAHPRQHTMRALMDWSFDLCSPEEQLLWARLPVFAASFELEAVEHICADEILPREHILDLVTALVDKSILTRKGYHDGAVRYRLLETIREYGRMKPTGYHDEKDAQRRHRDYYLALAERGEIDWMESWGTRRGDRARHEQPNFRLALEFCLSHPGEAEDGLRMAVSLWVQWRAMGLLTEGRRWFDRLLAVADRPSPVRAKALWVNAWLATLQADLAAATVLLAEAEEFGEGSVPDHVAEIRGLGALLRRDHALAARLLETALAGHQRRGDHASAVLTLHRLAQTALAAGDAGRAHELAARCIAEGGVSTSWAAVHAQWILGLATWRLGDPAAAAALEHDTARRCWAHGDLLGVTLAVQALAWIAAATGEPARAARLLGAAGRVWRDVHAAFPFLTTFQEECAAQATAALSEDGFQAAFAAGSALSDAEMIEEALKETPEPARDDDRGRTLLTRREQQIAHLVADGLSNPDIARELFISARTAETHVQNILTKLGFRSRAQIAGWVVGQRSVRETAGSP